MARLNFYSSIFALILSYLAICTAHREPEHRDLGARDLFGLGVRASESPSRNVYAVSDIALHPVAVSPTSGRNLLYGHVRQSRFVGP